MPDDLFKAIASITDRLISLASEDAQLRLHLRQVAQAILRATGTPEVDGDSSPAEAETTISLKAIDSTSVVSKSDPAIGPHRELLHGTDPCAEPRAPLPELRLGQSVQTAEPPERSLSAREISTPIAETAVRLKQQLAEAGLREGDDKRLTLLAHSMGGLVSRWFIARERGNRVVNHLVMFGTPTNGSPFGNVDMARRLTGLLTTLAINTFSPFAPFGAALLSVLVRSQKVTPTLEQMNPGSEFTRMVNTSDDPGVRYTIVSGDIRDYREESDKQIRQLIAKLCGGPLFEAFYQDAAHDIAVSDIAVSDTSIRGIPNTLTARRKPIAAGRRCDALAVRLIAEKPKLRRFALRSLQHRYHNQRPDVPIGNVRLCSRPRPWALAFRFAQQRHRHPHQRLQARACRGTFSHPWVLQNGFAFLLAEKA